MKTNLYSENWQIFLVLWYSAVPCPWYKDQFQNRRNKKYFRCPDPAYLPPFPALNQIPNPNLILNPYPMPNPDPHPDPPPTLSLILSLTPSLLLPPHAMNYDPGDNLETQSLILKMRSKLNKWKLKERKTDQNSWQITTTTTLATFSGCCSVMKTS